MTRTVLSQSDVEALRAASKSGGLALPESRLRALGLEGVPIDRGDGLNADDYKSKLLKYIPAEVVALYLTLDSIVRSSRPSTPSWSWFVFLIGLMAVPVYLWRIQQVHKRLQLIISSGAFVVWVLAIGGPFVFTTWYSPLLGGVLLIVYTFFIPLLVPGGRPQEGT